MPTRHGFCSLHRIAYDRQLDPTCPQCMIGHVNGAQQLDWEPIVTSAPTVSGGPIDPASGARLDAITLAPAK